jgi:hypothetical protein
MTVVEYTVPAPEGDIQESFDDPHAVHRSRG